MPRLLTIVWNLTPLQFLLGQKRTDSDSGTGSKFESIGFEAMRKSVLTAGPFPAVSRLGKVARVGRLGDAPTGLTGAERELSLLLAVCDG